MNIGQQIMWIEQNMPDNYDILIRTNNGNDGICSDCDWLVHFYQVIKIDERTHHSRTVYKDYDDNLGLMLYEVISNIKRITRQN